MPQPLMTLDPPYRLTAKDLTFRFIGWTSVDDVNDPHVRLTLNGVEAPIALKVRPDAQAAFPDESILGLAAEVDFRALLAAASPASLKVPFLLEAELTSDRRVRTFEYAVTDEWLAHVFERPMKARRIPPERLQIRVAGAAAGEYHQTGCKVAEQIVDLLRGAGDSLRAHRDILDFGCGPGRVTSVLHDLHPSARLRGVDIDADAISWAQSELSDIADFQVGGTRPPLPFKAETFDLIVCISVFTHFPEGMQWLWLSELRRVLKPGGVLLTSKLDPDTLQLPHDVRAEGVAKGFVYWSDADATAGLPDFYRLAYHTRDYVQRHWSQYFEVLHIGSRDLNGAQDAVLLRRPRHALSWLPAPVRQALYALRARLVRTRS